MPSYEGGMDFGGLVASLGAQIAVIGEAPIPFFAAIIIAGIIIWRVIDRLYRGKIETLEARIQHRDDRIADLERRTGPALDPGRLDALDAQVRQLLPRRLTDEQKHTIHQVLGDEGGGIIVSAEVSSPDAIPYRHDFWQVFHRAGWEVATSISMGRRNSPPCGLTVKVLDPSKLTPKQSRVLRALGAAGLQWELAQDHIGNLDIEIELTARTV